MNFENPTIIRRQLGDILNLLGSPQIQQDLQKVGKRVDIAKLIEMVINTFPNKEYESLIIDYVETPEGLDAALAGMAGEEANARWQEFMSPYFEALGGKHPDQNMVELEEIFHSD